MVNGTGRGQHVRRREIADADLDAVTDLLCRGFPARPRACWTRGLRRMAERTDVPPGCPRFGVLIETATGPVGVLLMLFRAEGERLRCNLSSWYAEPAYRMHAPLLIAAAMKRRDVTFTNLSPAPNTWATIETQGFKAVPTSTSLVMPGIARGGPSLSVIYPPAGGFGDCPEAALLDDHVGYGCIVPVVATPDGPRPFVFLPFRISSGRVPLPLAQLVYCRDVADYVHLAGAIGRSLLRRGCLGVVIDGEGSCPAMGLRLPLGRRTYVRGPHPPRIGNLAYTERVIFGS